MSRSKENDLTKLVKEYSNAVAKYGPESSEALRIRNANKDNRKFTEMAEVIDKIKNAVGGAGVEECAAGALSAS